MMSLAERQFFLIRISENRHYVGLKCRKMVTNHVPNLTVIDKVVPVNQKIAERNDFSVLLNAAGDFGVEFGEPTDSFANDLEIALDRLSKKSVRTIVVKGLSVS
jgi:hypothetical protein